MTWRSGVPGVLERGGRGRRENPSGKSPSFKRTQMWKGKKKKILFLAARAFLAEQQRRPASPATLRCHLKGAGLSLPGVGNRLGGETRTPPSLLLPPNPHKTLSARLILFRFSQGGGGGREGGERQGCGESGCSALSASLRSFHTSSSFYLPPPTQTSKHGAHAQVRRGEREGDDDDDDDD